jgi:hypothetical protein
MINVLEQAIEKLKQLPEEQQAYAAAVIEHIAVSGQSIFTIPDDHRAAVLEGLAQARRGELVADEAVDSQLRQPWR